MTSIINLFNEISGFVSLLALLVSAYSVWYTRKQNRKSIEIEYIHKGLYDMNHLPFIKFAIFNNSPSALKITSLKLLDSEGHTLKLYPEYKVYPGYSPSSGIIPPMKNMISSYYASNTFKNISIIPANESVDFTYYLEFVPETLAIKIKSDEPLSWWSKTKLFHVQPLQAD